MSCPHLTLPGDMQCETCHLRAALATVTAERDESTTLSRLCLDGRPQLQGQRGHVSERQLQLDARRR